MAQAVGAYGLAHYVTLMLCVLDNAPHAGFVIGPLLTHDLDMRLEWTRSFDHHGGAWVVLEAGTLTGGHPTEAGTAERWSGLRGGFAGCMQTPS